ncbi:MAG: ABC transporter permease, partial [Clostridiales bacterium]|nr:ABC transporter permease [Clostridiales bacterium]
MDILFYLIQNTLPVAVALLLVALGGMYSERSGVIN